jgi:hypothetical protein
MLASDAEAVVDEPVLPLASALVQPAVATTKSRTSRNKTLLRSANMCSYSLQKWWL